MRSHRNIAGFGMVEILVAMVIGMITVLIIMQVMATTESQRRTVTSGSDSGTTAALAMQELQRDLMNAGFGMTVEPNLFSTCGNPSTTIPLPPDVSAYNAQRLVADSSGQPPTAITIATRDFQPIVINPSYVDRTPGANTAPADTNTDVIQVMYSGSDFFAGRGIKVKDEGTAGDLRTITDGGVVYTTSALAPGDLALIVQGANCIIVQVNGVPAADRITRTAGTWNEGGNLNRGLSFGDPAVAGTPGVLYSLGSQERFVMRAFAIRNGRLTVCSPLVQNCRVASQWQPVADGIVSMRAQLGVDTDNNDVADEWIPLFGGPAVTLSSWEDAKAIRVALVARGQHREREPVSNADCTPSWAGDDNDSPAPSRNCPGSGTALHPDRRTIVLNSLDTPDAAAWAQYRHRVVQTTIALRNAFWSNN